MLRNTQLNAAAERLYLVPHSEAGDFQARYDDLEDPFRWDLAGVSTMRERSARKLKVSEIGTISNVSKQEKIP